MATEDSSPASSSKRPRPILLVLLGVLVAGFLWMQLGDSAGPESPSSNPSRPNQGTAGGDGPFDPKRLDVRLESLEAKRPEPGEAERDPFRFKPKPQPAPPPQTFKPPVNPVPDVPQGPPQPPPPPPITVKYAGKWDMPDGSVRGMFTDCTTGRRTGLYREGELILGQYRLVKIGLTSAVVEHIDGRGRTTLAMNAQECVWK